MEFITRKTLEADYEQSMLHPLAPLDLAENRRVQVTITGRDHLGE